MNTRPQTLTARCFSMMEVVLALIVVIVGIVGVIGLFPVGLERNRKTVGSRSAADAADQFLHHMAGEIKNDWNVTKAFPDTMPTVTDTNAVWSSQTLLANSNTKIHYNPTNTGDNWNPAAQTSGLFSIKQTTPGNVVDFTGVIRTWKEMTEHSDPRLNGDVVPFGLLALNSGDTEHYGFVRGDVYTLKYGSGSTITPGNFGALNLNPDSASGGGSSNYESNVVNGYPDIQVGDKYYPETGNMAGPTRRGVTDRLSADLEYVRVPVVTGYGSGGSGQVDIVAFLPFKLMAIAGNGGSAEVQAQYVGSDSSVVMATTARQVVLKCEVSWPAEMPYSQRQTAIFSLSVFKPGARLAQVPNP